MGPAKSKSRLGFSPEATICERTSFSATFSMVNSEVIPPLTRSETLNRRPKAGLRMSRPQRITFLPNNAKDMARLAALKVLPSPEPAEVNMITFSPPFSMNWMFVRKERKISSICVLLSAWTAMPASPLACSEATATSATMGSRVRSATSS